MHVSPEVFRMIWEGFQRVKWVHTHTLPGNPNWAKD
jgi:hypothetical protein